MSDISKLPILASSSQTRKQYNYLSFASMAQSNASVHPSTSISLEDHNLKLHQLTRKIDRRIIPLLFILFMISFLDRANIGHAKLFGLEFDLQLTPGQYAWSLSIFFFGYILFEVPSNLMLKRTSPPVWFALIMVPWGLTLIAMAFVKGYTGLATTRFILGIFEAGLLPGIVFYLSFWYTREQQGTRLTYVICAVLFSGAFGGLISYCVGSFNGWGGLKGWQWIFFIEGLFTVLFGGLTWWLLPSQPEKVSWLSNEEKELLINQLRASFIEANSTRIDVKEIWAGILDYKTYLISVSYFGFACSVYSMALVSPTLVNRMGFSVTTSMLLTAPPYLIAIPFGILIANRSDRSLQRAYFVMGLCALALIGYAILIFDESFPGRYIGLTIVLCATTPCSPIILALNNNNTQGATKSATTSAMIIMLANLSGVVAGQLYWPEDAPYFRVSHSINLGLLALSIISTGFLRYMLTRENRRLDRLENSANEVNTGPEPSTRGARKFRYVL